MAGTNEIYAQQYSENIMPLAQQGASKLLHSVYLKNNITGEHFYQDQIGQWTMSDKVGDNPATPQSSPNLSRRRATIITKHNGVLLDKSANLKILSDPKASYTESAQKSLGRAIDAEIIRALGATSNTGKEGAGSVALPASQKIADSGVGLTFAKVRDARKILNRNDVESEDCYFVVSPDGISDLLTSPEAASSDYNTINAIQNGGFDGKMWMGFKWIMSTQAPKTLTIRTCYAYHKNGLCLGMAEAPKVRIDERADLSYSWQIYYTLEMGATRLEEERVVQVDIKEAA